MPFPRRDVQTLLDPIWRPNSYYCLRCPLRVWFVHLDFWSMSFKAWLWVLVVWPAITLSTSLSLGPQRTQTPSKQTPLVATLHEGQKIKEFSAAFKILQGFLLMGNLQILGDMFLSIVLGHVFEYYGWAVLTLREDEMTFKRNSKIFAVSL